MNTEVSCEHAKTLSTAFESGTEAESRGATQVLDRGAEAVARGAVPCVSQVLHRGAEAVARGAARCASRVPHRGAQAAAQTVSCSNVALPQ